ncbi:dihydrofolate reductase family protein [Streptosporangium sp. NBC_01469]|uniref:dihydrofolate reductase family protein n=1 Tax=Streptosporangium sp. NBC_01469 TaxID=2903898 RepID=UPI002E2DAC4D|nr:dihydrofolate reductase family protein [Streptosporangium sp. NBC_01469]
MRKIITMTQTTLDGFIDNPHLWSMPYTNEESMAYAMDLALGSDALLLGRVTYVGMSQAWPGMSNPYADHVNSIQKYVVSSTLEKAEWEPSTIIHGDDLVATVTELKKQPGGNIMIWGCGQLTDTLMEHGLLDEYRLLVSPVIVGQGQRLFRGENVTATLELVDSTTFDTGLLALTYRPVNAAGEQATAG